MTGTVDLLDSNVVIGLLDERPQALHLKAQFNFTFETIAISQITRIELLSFPNLNVVEEPEDSIIPGCLPCLDKRSRNRGGNDRSAAADAAQIARCDHWRDSTCSWPAVGDAGCAVGGGVAASGAVMLTP